MQDMITFSTTVFESLTQFLLAEPISYLFGLIVVSYMIKVIFSIRRY